MEIFLLPNKNILLINFFKPFFHLDIICTMHNMCNKKLDTNLYYALKLSSVTLILAHCTMYKYNVWMWKYFHSRKFDALACVSDLFRGKMYP